MTPFKPLKLSALYDEPPVEPDDDYEQREPDYEQILEDRLDRLRDYE